MLRIALDRDRILSMRRDDLPRLLLQLAIAVGSSAAVSTATADAPNVSADTAEAIELDAGPARNVELIVGQRLAWHVSVPKDRVMQLLLQQQDGVVQLRVRPDDGGDEILFQNDAGRAARLRVNLLTHSAAVDRAGWHVVVQAAKADQAVRFSIALTPPRAVEPHDRTIADAQRALAMAEQDRRASGSLESGRAATATQLVDDATRLYRRTLALAATAADRCLPLMAHSGLARMAFARGDYAAARNAAQHALTFDCGDDPGGAAERAVALRTLGSALGYLGDFTQGAARSEQALALYRQSGDPGYQAMVLGNLTANYRVLGDTGKALVMAQAALKLAESIGDGKRALFVRESQAAIHMQRGELALALELYRRVIDDLSGQPYPLVEGLALNSLGLLYRQLGDPAASIDYLQRAEAAWLRNGDEAGVAESRLNLADAALAEGRLDAALGWFQQALDYDLAHHAQREEAHARLGIGEVAAARGDHATARASLLQAGALAQHIGAIVLAAASELALGDLADRNADPAVARRHYREALVLARRSDDIGTQTTALASLARLASDRDDVVAALPAIEKAVALIEQERALINPPDLRTSYFASRRAYYDLLVDVLMQNESRSPGHGYAERALEATERARARALQDRLAERSIHIDRGLDPALLTSERSAELQLAAASQALVQLAAKSSESKRENAQRELDRAGRELDAVRGRIRAANPRYAELAHPAAPRLADIQHDLLDADSVVMVYWLGARRSQVWRVTRDSLQAASLPSASEIEHAALAWRDQLQVAPRSAVGMPIEALAAQSREQAGRVAVAAARLRNLITAVVWTTPAGGSVVVADGALNQVPLGLLWTDPQSSTPTPATAYLPALAVLRGLRALPRKPISQAALAVIADPVFRSDDARLARVLATSIDHSAESLAALPGARNEADAILAAADPQHSWRLDGFAANRESVLATNWLGLRAVHFAAHAILDAAQPQLSGIVLSSFDAQGRAQDGVLRSSDIYNLDMPVDLVVLGVCDAAAGPQVGGEGIFSLSRAFFHAGARHVLASLWPVDDRASARLLTAFHLGVLQRHEAPALALANAQRELAASGRWQAPAYWAGFVLQGDWQ